MDWVTSLSPDSSDNEQPSSDKNEFEVKLSSESCDKSNKNAKSNSGVFESTDVNSPLKHTKNDSKTISEHNNNLLNPENIDYSTDNITIHENKSDDITSEPRSQSLFSIVDSGRKINKYNKITIKSQQLDDSDLKRLEEPITDKGSTFRGQRLPKTLDTSSNKVLKLDETDRVDGKLQAESCEYVEKVDVNEALESFNKSNLDMKRLTNKWIDSKMNIKEIKADDLLSGSERERLTANPISTDDRKKFSLTTKLMECDDGQVITTNVARRTQKRKHQINWLAMESQDKEAEILERTAHMRKSKRETQMKYGW